MNRLFPLLLLLLISLSCLRNATGVENQKTNQEYDIAYISNRTGTNQLYKIDMNGDNEIRLTNDSENYFHPSFSADGSKLLFYSESAGNDEIYIMDSNGDNLLNISNSPSNDNLCQFSHDGSKVVFTSNRDGNREIYIMNSDGSNQTRLTYNNFTDHSPGFSPDGSQIVFYQVTALDSSTLDAEYNVYIIDIDGQNLQNLTVNTKYYLKTNFIPDYDYGVYDAAPVFSSDGSKIVFTTYYKNHGFDITLMDCDGKNQKRITNTLGSNIAPIFCPFGSKIIFRSHRYANFDLFLMNFDGTDQVSITPNTNHVYFSDFSPDGSKILFYDNNDLDLSSFKYKVYIMDSNGENRKMLSQSSWYHHDIFPIFQPANN